MEISGQAEGRYLGREFASGVRDSRVLGTGRRLDDASEIYIAKVKDAFEALRDIAAQIGGLLVLVATGSELADGSMMLERARESFAQACEQLSSACSTTRTQHFNRHLVRSVGLISSSLKAFSNAGRKSNHASLVPAALGMISAAISELRTATHCLPGFEIVDLRSACCGCANHDMLSIEQKA